LLIGLGGLALSAAMLVATASLVAARTTPVRTDRFWVGLLVAQAELGAVAVACSLAHSLDARAFLLAQAALLAAAVVVTRALRRRPREARRWLGSDGDRWARWRPTDPITLALAVALAVVLVASGLRQVVTPLYAFDDRMYHASRVAYWLQYETIFFPETHNQRQTVFPFGSELWFAWPLLFAKHEVVGRIVFWLGLPLGAIGVGTVAAAIGLSWRVRLAAALLYSATPTVVLRSVGLASDLWLPVFLLGAAYFSVRPTLLDERRGRRHLLAGFSLALAINVKATAMALGPGVLISALLEPTQGDRWRAMFGVARGAVAGAVASGLIVLLGWNVVEHGHPLGPPALNRVVQSELSAHQLYVHAVRTPLTLFEFPLVPTGDLRHALRTVGRAVARATGADTRLPLEDQPDWPGSFSFSVPRAAHGYSLLGMLWLPCLALVLAGAAAETMRSWPRPQLSPASLLAVIQVPVLLGVVFLVRWMAAADGPVRFWLGAYALSIPTSVSVLSRLSRVSTWARRLMLIVLVGTVGTALASELSRLDHALTHPLDASQLDEPYQAALSTLPAGARIMLVASQDTRDYPLFNPRAGYVNRVFAWGRAPFAPDRADAFVREHRITHVLVEDDQVVTFHWAGEMVTTDMVRWMRDRPGFQEMPLGAPPMRLFAVRGP